MMTHADSQIFQNYKRKRIKIAGGLESIHDCKTLKDRKGYKYPLRKILFKAI